MGRILNIANRLLGEQEAPAPPPPVANAPATSTTSSDIAVFPTPLLATKSQVKALKTPATRPAFGGPRKKRKRGVLKEAWFQSQDEVYEAALRIIHEKWNGMLGPYGMKVTSVGQCLFVTCPTGRVYEAFRSNGWIVVREAKTPVRDSDLGPLGKGKPIMAWQLPTDREAREYWSAQTLGEKAYFDGGQWILKTETMRALPPFVDFSGIKPLDAKTIERLREHFVVIDAKDYDGFNHVNVYADMYGGKGSRFKAPPKAIEVPKTPLYVPFEPPENRGDRLSTMYDWDDVAPIMASAKWFGKPGRIEAGRIFWGDRMRYTATVNSVDWLEYKIITPMGERWIAVHAVPEIPWQEFDQFTKEFLELPHKLALPKDGPPRREFDFVPFLEDTWDNNCDEVLYAGGLAYHRDGVWGTMMYCSYGGAGVPNASSGFSKMVSYYWRGEPDGLVWLSADPMNHHEQTSVKPGCSDFQVLVHPDLGEDRAAELYNRYTYST